MSEQYCIICNKESTPDDPPNEVIKNIETDPKSDPHGIFPDSFVIYICSRCRTNLQEAKGKNE